MTTNLDKNILVRVFKLKLFVSLVDQNFLDTLFKTAGNRGGVSLYKINTDFVFLKNLSLLSFSFNEKFSKNSSFFFILKLKNLLLSSRFNLSRFATSKHQFFDRRYSSKNSINVIATNFFRIDRDLLNMRAIMKYKFFVNLYLNTLVASSFIFSKFNRIFKNKKINKKYMYTHRFLVYQTFVKYSSFIQFNSSKYIGSVFYLYNIFSNFFLYFWSSFLSTSFLKTKSFDVSLLLDSFFVQFDFQKKKNKFFFEKLNKFNLIRIGGLFFISQTKSTIFDKGRLTGLFLFLRDLYPSLKKIFLKKNKSRKLISEKSRDRLNIRDFCFHFLFSKRDNLDEFFERQKNRLFNKSKSDRRRGGNYPNPNPGRGGNYPNPNPGRGGNYPNPNPGRGGNYPNPNPGRGGNYPNPNPGRGGNYPNPNPGRGGNYPNPNPGRGGNYPNPNPGRGGNYPNPNPGRGGNYPNPNPGRGGNYPNPNPGRGGNYPNPNPGRGGNYPNPNPGRGGNYPNPNPGRGGNYPNPNPGRGGNYPNANFVYSGDNSSFKTDQLLFSLTQKKDVTTTKTKSDLVSNFFFLTKKMLKKQNSKLFSVNSGQGFRANTYNNVFNCFNLTKKLDRYVNFQNDLVVSESYSEFLHMIKCVFDDRKKVKKISYK